MVANTERPLFSKSLNPPLIFIFKVFACPVCFLSSFSVDFCIDKAECGKLTMETIEEEVNFTF